MPFGDSTPARHPATLATSRYDRVRLAAEARVAIDHIRQLQAGMPDIQGWVTFFLGNQTGDATDLRLADYSGACRYTPLAATMPYTTEVIADLAAEGFSIKYCRIAVLEGRSLLRCHVDMYRSARLILPLTAQGTDFRHVFEDDCFAMDVGELWAINGDVCHGAANVAACGLRVALLLDAHDCPDGLPAWWQAPWLIPPARQIDRPAWSDAARQKRREAAEQWIAAGNLDAAEREWLFIPFEYRLTPAEGYEELIRFCSEEEERAVPPSRDFWRDRRTYWEVRNCRCA
jgi:hypothetical protein